MKQQSDERKLIYKPIITDATKFPQILETRTAL